MISQWLSWLNYSLFGLALLLCLATAFLWLKHPNEIVSIHPQSKKGGLPKTAFELPIEAYQQIGAPLLALQQEPLNMQLPDLRQQLIYYGRNGRPDAQSNHTLLHFSLSSNNKMIVSTPPNEALYLIYDRNSHPGRYTFSPNNEKSSLWIEATPIDNEVQVKVTLENEKGEKITEPETHGRFRLPEKEYIRYGGVSWEIGPFRVDGTLLARQKARWFGPDRFLEHHGGEEYQHVLDKQRIDFGENEAIYSVFVKWGDCLIWDKEHWQVVTPGKESIHHPLLVVKKVDERLMTFELWDVEGKGKIVLNLLKSTEPWPMQHGQGLQHMFKFVGARTRTQCVFEINHERMVLCPSDWLLLTPKGWRKLVSEEDINNYVNRKITGTMFVFEGIARKEERQILKGTLYNPTRTDFHTIELALQTGGGIKPPTQDPKELKEEEEMSRERPPPITRSHETAMQAAKTPPTASLKEQSSNR